MLQKIRKVLSNKSLAAKDRTVTNKTPNKFQSKPLNQLSRSKSGIGFTDWKHKEYNEKALIKNNPCFVDYSETISNWESKFDRAIATPNRDTSENLSTTSKITQRRTRQMRKMNSTSKNVYQLSETPEWKIIVDKVKKNRPETEKKMNANYYSQNDKRGNTPSIFKRPRLFNWQNEILNQSSKLNSHISNLKKPDTSHKNDADNTAKDSTSYIVNENIRLSLYKSCRTITLKHLNSLLNKSTPEIRQIMKLFWMLLNALK